MLPYVETEILSDFCDRACVYLISELLTFYILGNLNECFILKT